MNFRFYPLRFEFTAAQSLFFPPGKASNTLRGALGTTFRRNWAYGTIFAPVARDRGPSGLSDSPRPFVFRARHLDGLTIQPGHNFWFDLNVFALAPEALACFIEAFAVLAREGLGPGRGKAELVTVQRLALGGLPARDLYTAAVQRIAGAVEPVTLSLEPPAIGPGRIRVEFLSPTELKHGDQIVERPEFPILFGRIRDRIGTLRALYGEGPLEMDYKAMGDRAAQVKMTDCRMRREESGRRSSRTGQTHSIGGFIGTADYEGDLREFLPWLGVARYTGVGRQSVWGKGEIRIILSA